MLKIGEFSKLSQLTVKALRFYEKEGLLQPASIDRWTGYRFYESAQLADAARIKACRQLGLSIEDIRKLQAGGDLHALLRQKKAELQEHQEEINAQLAAITVFLEEEKMKVEVIEKIVPRCIVYSAETVLADYGERMRWIPALGEKLHRLYPKLQCAEPPYEFCEYLDGEYREQNIRVRHSEAVTSKEKASDWFTFRELPETKVLSIYHKGSYDTLVESYAALMKYAEKNGYHASGCPRECYIDGIWNKESPSEWLTELQLPIHE